jgi:hypothetical protein
MYMVEMYFNAERTTGLLFTVIGVLAIGVAITLRRHSLRGG